MDPTTIVVDGVIGTLSLCALNVIRLILTDKAKARKREAESDAEMAVLVARLREAETCLTNTMPFITPDGTLLTGDELHTWILTHQGGTMRGENHQEKGCTHCANTVPEKASAPFPEKPSEKNPGKASTKKRENVFLEKSLDEILKNLDHNRRRNPAENSPAEFLGKSHHQIVENYLTHPPHDLIKKVIGYRVATTLDMITTQVVAQMSAGDFPSWWSTTSADTVFTKLVARDHGTVDHILTKPCVIVDEQPLKQRAVHYPHRWNHQEATTTWGSTCNYCPGFIAWRDGGDVPVIPGKDGRIKHCQNSLIHTAHDYQPNVRSEKWATCPGVPNHKAGIPGRPSTPIKPCKIVADHAAHDYMNLAEVRGWATCPGVVMSTLYKTRTSIDKYGWCGELGDHKEHVTRSVDSNNTETVRHCDGRTNPTKPCASRTAHPRHSWSDAKNRAAGYPDFRAAERTCPGVIEAEALAYARAAERAALVDVDHLVVLPRIQCQLTKPHAVHTNVEGGSRCPGRAGVPPRKYPCVEAEPHHRHEWVTGSGSIFTCDGIRKKPVQQKEETLVESAATKEQWAIYKTLMDDPESLPWKVEAAFERYTKLRSMDAAEAGDAAARKKNSHG